MVSQWAEWPGGESVLDVRPLTGKALNDDGPVKCVPFWGKFSAVQSANGLWGYEISSNLGPICDSKPHNGKEFDLTRAVVGGHVEGVIATYDSGFAVLSVKAK